MAKNKQHIISRFLIALLLPLMQLALVSCGQIEESPECRSLLPTEAEIYMDLVSEYPYAERVYDSTGIRMDDPESTRQLGPGWSFVEGKDRKHVWSVGLSSIVRFVNRKDCDKILTFECLPYVYMGMKTQHIKVFLNDRPIGKTTLKNGQQSYSFDLPASILKKGENILEFQHAYSTVPAQIDPKLDDNRDLAVSFVSIAIHPISRELFSIQKSPGECEIIMQPTDTILDYFLELPRNAVLTTAVADSIETRNLRYEISVKEDAGPEKIIFAENIQTDSRLLDRVQFWKKRIHWAATRIPLTDYGKKIVRLRFSVSESGGNNAHGAGSWLAPAIVLDDDGHSEATPEAPRDGPITTEAAGENLERYQDANIFIYVIDALRADHLGCYGYHRDTSPVIDSFSRDSVLFERFLVESSWTRSSVASMMTGLAQRLHGIKGYEDGLDNSIKFISEHLREHGYKTAFVSTNFNISETYGFKKGFDFFNVGDFEKLPTSSEKVAQAALGWLEINKGKPIFLYLQTTDPHDPYEPREEFRIFKTGGENSDFSPKMSVEGLLGQPAESLTEEILNNLKDLYDAEILQNDYAFGRFINALKQWDLYDNSIIILTADHGEEFFEHAGFSHGRAVYRESVHIPFIMKLPGQRFKGTRIAELAQIIDVSPTLLDLVGIPVPSEMSGVSLKPMIAGKMSEDRIFLSEIDMESPDVRASSLYWKKWKLNIPYGPTNLTKVKDREPFELFNIEDDWEETENLYREYPVLTGYLRQMLKKKVSALDNRAKQFGKPVKIPTEELPEDVRNGLKALGYLN